MKIRNLCLGMMVLVSGCQVQKSVENKYVVVSGKGIATDTAWAHVAETLRAKHNGTLIVYQDSVGELLPQFQKINPRYVAIVEKPENLNKNYIIGMHKLSRRVDSDIYADFLWGVITGYDAQGAMKMVNNNTEPLVVKDAVATIMELNSGKWFDRYAWVDDHTCGLWGEKQSAEKEIATYQIEPTEVLQKFYDIYGKYDPDLVVTAAHATENNLEMPYSLGNIKAKNGQLYADFPDAPQNLIESGKRKVYFAVGNCLIGNVNNTKESMAIAWMNSGNAATMIGYVVTTWYGRNGWGGLKYWLTTPGRYSLAEAVYLNQQDLVNQLYKLNPKLMSLDYPYNTENFNKAYDEAARMMRKNAGITAFTAKHFGFLHDRDVLAYYGDPKWNVRLQQVPEENDFTVTSKIKRKKCIVTITTNSNFSIWRMKGGQFKQEHVQTLPFSYFFPERLKNPRLVAGETRDIAVDENFMFIYNPDFQPDSTYTVEFDID